MQITCKYDFCGFSNLHRRFLCIFLFPKIPHLSRLDKKIFMVEISYLCADMKTKLISILWFNRPSIKFTKCFCLIINPILWNIATELCISSCKKLIILGSRGIRQWLINWCTSSMIIGISCWSVWTQNLMNQPIIIDKVSKDGKPTNKETLLYILGEQCYKQPIVSSLCPSNDIPWSK